jgi:hypothetical protein
MKHMSAAIPLPAPASPPDADHDQLLRLAGDLSGVRALVIAERSLDLLCALIRRGCGAATAIRSGSKPDADDYGLVIAVPDAAAFSPDRLVRQIRGGLARGGRLVACVPNGAAATALVRRLRLNGFSVLPPIRLRDVTLLRADLRVAS